MAMIYKNSVFLMIPRTGTSWVRTAIKYGAPSSSRPSVLGRRIDYSSDNHHQWDIPRGVRWSGNSWVDGGPDVFTFTFVRDPETWVRSRWALGPWRDWLTGFWVPDEAEFRAAVTDDMVRAYFKPFEDRADFVGHTETLADDLVKALTLAGEVFDEGVVRGTARFNETDYSKIYSTGEFLDGSTHSIPQGTV